MSSINPNTVNPSNFNTAVLRRKIIIETYPAPGKNQSTALSKNISDANIPDSYVESTSRKKAFDNYKKSPSRNLFKTVALGLPVADSFVSGAAAAGNATAKAGAAMNTGKNWGVFIAATMLYNKVAQALIKNVPGLKKFSEENPTATTVGMVAGGVALGNVAVNKANNLNVGEKVLNLAAEKVEKSGVNENKFINEKVLQPAEKALNSKSGKLALKAAVPALLGGLVMKELFDISKIKSDENKYKNQMNMQRLNSAKSAVNTMLADSSKPQLSIVETKRIIFSNEQNKK